MSTPPSALLFLDCVYADEAKPRPPFRMLPRIQERRANHLSGIGWGQDIGGLIEIESFTTK
jgi:hypothetical protein